MTEIIYVNSYDPFLKGSYNLTLDRIEINMHFSEDLQRLIIKHELKHRDLHKKYGLKALPLHIFHDYKEVFRIYGTPKLYNIWKSYKQPLKEDWKEKLFEFIYLIAMTPNAFLMVLASCIRKVREFYATL